MAITPEGKVKEEIKKVLEFHCAYWFMPRGSTFGTAGVPDFVGCINGRFFAVEAKSATGKLTALQKQQLAKIEDKGGKVFVVRDSDTLTVLSTWLSSVRHAKDK